MRPTFALRTLVGALLIVAAPSRPALAGGGPENVLLVVNANSADSKEVANHYTRLRNLPANNVLELDYRGALDTVTGEVFRKQILEKIVKAIDDRGLALQIDMVAYSTDFPWRVLLKGDHPKGTKLPKELEPIASLTGATYLFGFVLAKNPGVVSFESNWYYAKSPKQPASLNRSKCQSLGTLPSRAFRFRYAWDEAGQRAPRGAKGRRYLLSTMLGVTNGRSNTTEEVIACLTRATAADAQPPHGTVYFMRNNDIRSSTRHNCYAGAADLIKASGGQAVVQVGVRPEGAQDVAGLVMGSGKLKLDTAGMKLLPGAICEHLTSLGGIFSGKQWQTSLADLIRAGATGSCGTVAEPYAIQAKFPSPALQAHYRRGCSLAESFYQSVAAPYQLLIVGDPLCQPWAKRPGLVVEGWPSPAAEEIRPGALSTLGFAELGIDVAPKPAPPASEQPPATDPSATETAATESDEAPGQADEPPALSITPKITPTAPGGAGVWELFVDGKLRMRLPSGKTAAFTDEQLGPGWHELRCVAINPDPIESQRRQEGEITVGDAEVSLQLAANPSQAADGSLAVRVEAPGAERVLVRHHSRLIATITGPEGEASINRDAVGKGPVRLQAVAMPSGSASAPIWVTVE